MIVICRNPYQSEISLKNGSVHIIGSLNLLNKMAEYKQKYGSSPACWPAVKAQSPDDLDDLLINEFILKCNSQFKLAYEHLELCHCRMVTAERVYDSIKQGCSTVEDVGRAVLAGTGCGSCRPDIEKLLKQFSF